MLSWLFYLWKVEICFSKFGISCIPLLTNCMIQISITMIAIKTFYSLFKCKYWKKNSLGYKECQILMPVYIYIYSYQDQMQEVNLSFQSLCYKYTYIYHFCNSTSFQVYRSFFLTFVFTLIFLWNKMEMFSTIWSMNILRIIFAMCLLPLSLFFFLLLLLFLISRIFLPNLWHFTPIENEWMNTSLLS